jgi:type I restriction enzyme S subunit
MKNGTTTEQNQDGRGLPVTRIETISDGTIDRKRVRFVELDAVNVERWRLQQGDILLSHINSVEHIGKSAIYQGAPEILIHGMNLLLLRPDTKVILPEYLHFGLRSNNVRERIRSRCKRAINQASINQKELGVIELPVPALDEQRRIVDLLSRAEGILRLRREVEKKTAELIPALFLDMFGDPATNPKGWPMPLLQSVSKVVSGNGFPNVYQGKTEGQFPFYKVSDMNTKRNEIEMYVANNHISEDDLGALRAKTFPAGTVIFPKIGAAIATNKKRILAQPSCFDNNIMGIVADNNLSPIYLYALMLSKNLSDFASDSNPPSIRKTTVEVWKIPVPPILAQVKFAAQVGIIRAIQDQQTIATVKAQATFEALLAQTFLVNTEAT